MLRCPASMLLCESPRPWCCRACNRKYRHPTTLPAAGGGGGEPPVPACLLCGLQLGPSVPSILLAPPCPV